MAKMKLKVPVNSLMSAKQQIKAGADEFYMAFASDVFSNVTFSGRGRKSAIGQKTEVGYEEFKEIVKLAHDNNVLVEMAANTYRMTDDSDGGIDMQSKYLSYVEKGIDAGADRIIVADIGNIVSVKKRFPDIPITASVFFEAFNIYHVKFLESLGVQKIVLDHCVTIPEIEALVKNSNLEIEVFCQLGCSFMQYTCSLYHSTVEKANLGLPCRAKYKINGYSESCSILDTAEDCAICALPKLKDAGVSSIKVTGRDKEYKFITSITHIYSLVLSLIEQGLSIKEIHRILDEKYDFGWWRQGFCNEKRCKYKHTEYYA
jgi:putative protease